MGSFSLGNLPLVHGYGGLGEQFVQAVQPQGLRGARMLHLNGAGCELIGLDPDQVDPNCASAWLAGGQALPGSNPVAMAYSGHQFGQWAGQLGDGRALLLGEVGNAHGETWDVQLKGSGPTPFSRGGDGRAVFRSTLREYVAGEAMAGLGIPSTRSLAIFKSDEEVARERIEDGAMLVRLARCHVRFGTFQHFYAKQRFDSLRVLFGYSMERWFPELGPDADRPQAFLVEVAERTARLIAHWMSVGFCHGVMNTDNMSILGETIDYGPFAFLDDFERGFVCNTSDYEGRYAYSQQPTVGLWNVHRLVEAVLPLMGAPLSEKKATKLMERVSERYQSSFEGAYAGRMAGKLGVDPGAPAMAALLGETLDYLERTACDHTLFWRELCHVNLRAAFPSITGWDGHELSLAWWGKYVALRTSHPAGGNPGAVRAQMLATNPKFIPRNYLLQELIEEPDEERQRQQLDAWLTVLATPCEEHPDHEAWAAPPLGAQKALSIGCSS